MRVAYALVVAFLWPIAAFSQSVLSSSEIIERISQVGASAALHQLYQNENEWYELLTGIASGDSEWLRIGLELHRVSDAGTGEMIQHAMGEALEHQPSNVLKIVIPWLGVEKICGGPDIDDRRYDSYTLAINTIELRQRKLRDIETPQDTAMRDQCISELEKSKSGIAKFYEVEPH